MSWDRWSTSLTNRCGTEPLLIYEFGIEKHKSLIHDLKRTRHRLIIVVELIQDVGRSSLRKLDQQAFWRLNIIRSDKQMGVVGGDLNYVVALTKLATLLVKYNSIFIEGLGLFDDGSFSLQGFLRI